MTDNIFVGIYQCVVCLFFRYLPLCCRSFLSLFTIVLYVIFVVTYHCGVCNFCRYLPLYCLSFLSLFTIVLSVICFRYLPLFYLLFLPLFTIVLSVIFVVFYHCVVCHFKNNRQHNGK
jgi:hypothetical protein